MSDRVKFYNCAFEKIQLLGNDYDLIFGKWILHHLNYKEAINKILFYLKPNGQAVFIETSYLNPMIKIARTYLVGRFGVRRIGTSDEKPLGNKKFYMHNSYLKK